MLSFEKIKINGRIGNNYMPPFSIIIPAFNEEESIGLTVDNLKSFIVANNLEAEVIAVNDGSTDKTGEILSSVSGIKAINNASNKGYGASLKNGVKNSKYDWVLFYDADGQHNTNSILEMLKESPNADMVVGKREGYKGPSARQPGKKILKFVAEYLTGQKIPDINSGLRLIKKEYFNQFVHLLPNGFSLSTTITMSFLSAGLNIAYVPIKIKERIGGKSTVKQAKHGSHTLLLIFRIIMLFNPLKIFFPISTATATLTLLFLIWDAIALDISGTTIILFITTIFVFCFGLLADQISSIRRESHIKI